MSKSSTWGSTQPYIRGSPTSPNTVQAIQCGKSCQWWRAIGEVDINTYQISVTYALAHQLPSGHVCDSQEEVELGSFCYTHCQHKDRMNLKSLGDGTLVDSEGDGIPVSLVILYVSFSEASETLHVAQKPMVVVKVEENEQVGKADASISSSSGVKRTN